MKPPDPPSDSQTTYMYIPTGYFIFKTENISALVGCEPVWNWYAAQKEGVLPILSQLSGSHRSELIGPKRPRFLHGVYTASKTKRLSDKERLCFLNFSKLYFLLFYCRMH